MPSVDEIGAEIGSAGIESLGPIILGDDGVTVIVTVLISRDTSGRRSPSHAALQEADRRLQRMGLRAEFILRYEEAEQIESALRATILHAHADHLRNIFLSLDSSVADVWIEPKGPLTHEDLKEIERRARTFLELFDLRLSRMLLTSEEVLPSKYVLLTTVRKFAPVSVDELARKLEGAGISPPSIDWLTGRLDGLRKAGDVVRLGTGRYALTKSSLHRLGTTKDRGSPDISRLLALARRDG